MLSGLYTAASGMLTQQRVLNVVGNNLTNSQTTGFKSDTVTTSTYDFDNMIRFNGDQQNRIGTGSPVSVVDSVTTNFKDGILDQTERPFDMAIVGDGFFNIQGNQRQYLTRNGNFDVDEEGYLILEGQGRVLGENGEIQVGGSNFYVTSDGSIYNNDTNQNIGKLLITTVDDTTTLKSYENGMYSADNAVESTNSQIFQGTLERSNIDMNLEYTRLIEAQSAFKACSTALTAIDQMNAKAATLCSIT